MKIILKCAQSFCFAVLVLVCGVSRANDAVWNITATGTYDWTNVVNWLPNTTCPDGTGQSAFLTNDITGGQTIQLRKNIMIGTLAIGDAVASGGNYGTTLNNKSGESFTLTFNSGTAGTVAKITTGSSGTPKSYLSAPMALGSDLLVNISGSDSANSPFLYFNNVMAMNGHTLTCSNGVSGQTQITLDTGADFSGSGTIIYKALAGVSVNGSKAFGGTLVANQAFNLTAGGFTNAAECVVNGWVSNSTVRIGGSLESGNNSTQTTNPGQRFTRRRITLNGGIVLANGQASTVGTANDWQKGLEWVRDEVAVLDFKSGYNFISVKKAANTTGTVFKVGTVLRSRGTSVFFFTTSNTNALFTADNGTNLLIGAGGAVGSATMSIIPWMGVSPLSGTTAPDGFATYELATGFRLLNLTTEYTNSLTAGASYNVSLKTAPAAALAADVTVNAFRLSSVVSYNLGIGRTLTITSGGLFMEGNTLGESGTNAAGTVAFGAAEGVICVYGANASTIGAAITGSGGLTKANTGVLTLTGANSYSGTNHISGGTLQVGDGTYGSNLGSGNVEVHAGAIVRISCTNAVADTATVKLYNIGPDLYHGRMQLDAGVHETVRFLYFGDVGMPSGTYGATGSGAVNIRNDYFSGAGVLTVTGSASEIRKGTIIRVL